jgi:hypothetical protein
MIPSNEQPASKGDIDSLTKMMNAMQIERSRGMVLLSKDGELMERNTSTYRAYNTHWKQLESAFGTRMIHTITPDEIIALSNEAALRAIDTSKIRRAKKGVTQRKVNGAYIWVFKALDSSF